MKGKKTTPSPFWLGIMVVLSFGFGRGGEAVAANACQADDVCAPGDNPCVIAQNYDVAAGCTFDFGDRDVILQANKTLKISGCALPVSFQAGSLTTQSGSVINGRNAGGDCGADISISVNRDFTHDGELDVAGSAQPGLITVVAGGSVFSRGKWFANATTGDADGGSISLSVSGDVSFDRSTTIDLHGGGDATGGDFELAAAGNVTLNQTIDASGGNFDGGFITIEAGGTLTMATTRAVTLTASATGEGYGGEIDLLSGGDMTLANASFNGTIDLHGGGGFEGFAGDGGYLTLESGGNLILDAVTKVQGGSASDTGGYGGDVEIFSEGDIEITANLNLFGGGPDGDGGFLTIVAGEDLLLSQTVDLSGNGVDSGGGDADISAGATISITGSIDASGKSFGGGFVDIEASS
ncbi:MAG: hypothetical protein D6812_08325, partial [Deltaproteobacteria bacterium]